jgi:hypothetical protein
MKTRLVWLTLIMAAAAFATEADFGILTVTRVDTARLTAYCDVDGSVTPTPCDIVFEFHDLKGGTLKQATMVLQPGTGGYLDFTPASASPVQIDPCWKILRGVGFASLEVFDIFTQRTRVLINWGDRPAPSRGDVDFGLVGLTQLDTLRVGVFCEEVDGSVAPSPCDVTVMYMNAQGRTVKESRLLLAPETGGFLDLKLSETGGTAASRTEIHPCIKVASSSDLPLGAVVSSLAVIDGFTGLTITQAYPAVSVPAVQ